MTHRNSISILFLLTYIILFPISKISANTYPPGNWDLIIENQDIVDKTLVLEGSSGSNVLIINSRIYGTKPYKDIATPTYDGITLRNVNNVYIKDSAIYNIPGHGIVLRSTGSTSNVTIDNNKIYNILDTGILPKAEISKGVVHSNLVIKNNEIYNVGGNDKDHGIYIYAGDALIQDNTIYNSAGNGISIRSSGTIRGNKIWDTQKSCIRYFNDHESGPSKILTIENNICDTTFGPDYPLISLRYSPDGLMSYLVDDYIIRFNTLVSTSASNPGIMVESGEFDSKNVRVYGNIAINTGNQSKAIIPTYIDYLSRNYTSNSTSMFVKGSKPYDVRLTENAPAINFASGEPSFPNIDLSGKVRTANHLDAGAYQYQSSQVSSKPGDINSDQAVDLLDYNLLVAGYGTTYTIFDYNNLVANYGK